MIELSAKENRRRRIVDCLLLFTRDTSVTVSCLLSRLYPLSRHCIFRSYHSSRRSVQEIKGQRSTVVFCTANRRPCETFFPSNHHSLRHRHLRLAFERNAVCEWIETLFALGRGLWNGNVRISPLLLLPDYPTRLDIAPRLRVYPVHQG